MMSDYIELHNFNKTSISNLRCEIDSQLFVPFSYLTKKNIIKATHKIKKNHLFLLTISLNELTNLDVFVQNMIKLYRYAQKYSIPIGKKIREHHILIKVTNHNLQSIDVNNLISKVQEVLSLLLYNDTAKIYDYIYDKACEYFDNQFQENNLCDFQNDSCISQRYGKNAHQTMGCCYEFHYSKFDRISCIYWAMPLSNANWL